MPKKGYKQTEETKKKIRRAMKGKNVGNKNSMYGKIGKNNPNYGSKRSSDTIEKMRKSHIGKTIGNKNGMYGRTGSKHPRWKGDNISGTRSDDNYQSVHKWVRRYKGSASKYKCIDCNKQAQQWSNKDHKYKRNLDDYVPRCYQCHQRHDFINNM